MFCGYQRWDKMGKSRQTTAGNYSCRSHWQAADWKSTAWSDESWIPAVIFGSQHQNLVETIWKHEPIFPHQDVQNGGGGVTVWGDIFLAHFRRFRANWASLQHRSRAEFSFWPYLSLYGHSTPSFDRFLQQDNVTCHKTQIISNCFLENDNEVSIPEWYAASSVITSQSNSTFGMWWNKWFASWSCSQQICGKCVKVSGQYRPGALRNLSSILLNLCYKE